MKIVFSSDSIQRGGKERQLFILASHCLNVGIDLKIIALNNFNNSYIKEYNIDESIIIKNENPKLTHFKFFKKQLIETNPDLVITWDNLTSFFSLLICKRYKIKFINGSIRHGIRLFKFSHLFRSLICHLSPYIISNSYAGLKANNIKPDPRVFVLYNGIENKFLKNISKIEIEEKRNLIIPGYFKKPGTIYISVANFVPYKDYKTVLNALAVLKSMKQFYYLIIGDGPLRDEIEKAIKKQSLDNHVFLVGKTENILDYLFISDIMIHSSKGEGVSNAILEGMYAGLPIIATNVGGIPEIVFAKSSLMFPYKNDKALLGCLLAAPKLFADFDEESKEYKEHLSKFSVESMVKRFEEIIEVVRSQE
jgi:glycosyltransferase involved in cell wall biosynthesis